MSSSQIASVWLRGKITSASGGQYSAAPLGRPPYNWIKQEEEAGPGRLELATLRDVCVVDAFMIYLPATRHFVTEVSYPHVLKTWRIPHVQAADRLTLDTRRGLVEITEPVKRWVCQCHQSQTMPWCDGTHKSLPPQPEGEQA